MCCKIPYASKDLAILDAKIIRANQKLSSERGKYKPIKRLRAYQCFHCQNWHLTSQKKRKKGF